MKKETWMPVKGYEGLYEVSDRGRVKALSKQKKHVSRNKHNVSYLTTKERILPGTLDGRGYIHYRLRKDGKATLWKAHHLVAEAFLGYDRSKYDRKNVLTFVVDHVNRMQDRQ